MRQIVNFFRENSGLSSEAKTVVAGFPRGEVGYYFQPTETFYSEETASTYVKGLRYTVRKGNDKLDKLAHEWRDNNKVVIL